MYVLTRKDRREFEGKSQVQKGVYNLPPARLRHRDPDIGTVDGQAWN